MGSKVKEASEGKRHLGAAISVEAFKVSYTKSLEDDRIKQLKLLSKYWNQKHNLHTQLLLVVLKRNLPILRA